MQWNPSNLETNGEEECVLVSDMFTFNAYQIDT